MALPPALSGCPPLGGQETTTVNGKGLGPRKKKLDLKVSEGSASRTQGEGPGQLEVDAEGARAELGETPFFWTFPGPNEGVTPLRGTTGCAPIPNTGTHRCTGF